MKLKLLIFIGLLIAALFLFGCTDQGAVIPGLPFTSSQFFNKVTDLNYVKFLNGDYNGLFVVIDRNKLTARSFPDVNGLTLNTDWNHITGFPAPCTANQAVRIIGTTLTCVNLPTADINLSYANNTYVPYTGATKDVNLNSKTLYSGNVYIGENLLEGELEPIGVLGARVSDTTSFWVTHGFDVEDGVTIHSVNPDNSANMPLEIRSSETDFTTGGIIVSGYITGNKLNGTSAKLGTVIPTTSNWLVNVGSTERTTQKGGIETYLSGTDVNFGLYGTYTEVGSSVHNSGTTTVAGAFNSATVNNTTGTNYQVAGLINAAYGQPSSGSPTFARINGASNSAFLRATAGTPTATSTIGVLSATGFYPTSTAGTVSNAQGLQVNLNTGGAGGTQKITSGAGIFINEPLGDGNISNFNGIELSNRYYTYNGHVTSDYKGINIEGLNGGDANNLYGLYLGKNTRGIKNNWQFYSAGGNNYMGDANSITYTGNIVTNNDINTFNERIKNGDFLSPSNWTFPTGYMWDSINFEADKNANGTGSLTQGIDAVLGETYVIKFTVRNRTAGSVLAKVGTTTIDTISANGDFVYTFTVTNAGNLQFTPSATSARYSITNVSVIKYSNINTNNINILGNAYLLDNKKIYLGNANDASITYDGDNVIISPKEVGGGTVRVEDTIAAHYFNSLDGGSGLNGAHIGEYGTVFGKVHADNPYYDLWLGDGTVFGIDSLVSDETYYPDGTYHFGMGGEPTANANNTLYRDTNVTGFVNTDTNFRVRGTQGITKNFSVRKADDSGSCDMNFVGGILIGSTC